MAHEAQRIRLRTLAAQIETARIGLGIQRPQDGSHDRTVLDRQIDGWKRDVENARRSLKSKAHLDQMVFEKERFGKTAASARHRLKSQNNNHTELSLLVKRVNTAVLALIAALNAGPDGEVVALKGLEHALDNWAKSAGSDEALLTMPVSPQVQAEFKALQQVNPQPLPDMPGPMGIVDFFTFTLSAFVLLKALNKKRK